MGIEHDLQNVLTQPSAETVWQLRGSLLETGHAVDSALLHLLGDYNSFLSSLAAATSAVEYTNLAYWLSASAALVSLAEDNLMRFNPLAILRNLVPKGLDEGLDVLAAGRYVASAETAIPNIANQATWQLYNHLWAFSQDNQTTLTLSERRQLIDQLFAPIQNETRPLAQTILAGRLFQYLLLAHLAQSPPQ